MREILFRGKDVRTGYWKEGSLVREWLGVDMGYTIRDVPDRFNQIAFRSIVDPKTVGQYTGLTDKDDRKIFEGDIVNILAIDKNRVVRFDEGGFCLDAGSLRDYRCFGKMAIKVIGNIYDNPELLGADK